MRQSRLSLRCTTEAEVRALREQIDEGTVRVPDELVEFGAEVEIDVQLPGGAGALLTGITGTSGALGVSVAIDPLTPNARDAIERAARELDPPTKPKTDGYGPDPITQRVPRIEVPAEAFRDDQPAPPPEVAARPPPPTPPPIPAVPKMPPLPKLPPAVSKLRAQTSPGVRTGALAPREPTPPPRKIEPPSPPVAAPPPLPPPPAPPAPEPPARASVSNMTAPAAPTESAEQLLAAGKLDDALVAFMRRAKASPYERAAHVGVELIEGLLARDRGDRFEAAQRFEAALAIDPDDARAALELTEIRRAVVEARLAGLTKLVEKKDD